MPPSFNKQEPIKVFDKDNLNIADLAVCEMKMEMCERVLLELGHMLEDANLNATQMVRVACFERDWRKRRRYWKSLGYISREIGSAAQSKLIGAMTRHQNFLDDNKRKSQESVDHLNKVMQSEKKQRERETENVLDEIKNKLKGE